MTKPNSNSESQLSAKARGLFRETFGEEPDVVARAPGRIEVIGNHTDYNKGSVVGAAIDRGIVLAASLNGDERLNFVSEGHGLESIEARRPFSPLSGDASWVNYPLGVLSVLEEKGMPAVSGLNIAVVSDLPTGAGLSSSAAMELATAVALIHLQNFEISRADLVSVGRKAENDFVGVPCGILDQGVSGFGRKDSLVHIDCREPTFSTIALPGGVRFWVFNTHKKHALLESLYSTRHAECMGAAEVLEKIHTGLTCLADASSIEVEAARNRLSSDQFKRAKHVVEEIARVGAFMEALKRSDLETAGSLLFASHESSRLLFENSTDELDFLVDRLRGVRGVYGARLTGGGFGGAVMAMTDNKFNAANADEVASAYAKRFGTRPDCLTCATDDGASIV